MGLFRWLGSPRGEYERESHARRAEKLGDYEQAALYRACLAKHEWHKMGWKGEFGSYERDKTKKATEIESLYEATNGAYGAKRDFAPIKDLRRDLEALIEELGNTYYTEEKRIILREIGAIRDEIHKQDKAEAVNLAAE